MSCLTYLSIFPWRPHNKVAKGRIRQSFKITVSPLLSCRASPVWYAFCEGDSIWVIQLQLQVQRCKFLAAFHRLKFVLRDLATSGGSTKPRGLSSVAVDLDPLVLHTECYHDLLLTDGSTINSIRQEPKWTKSTHEFHELPWILDLKAFATEQSSRCWHVSDMEFRFRATNRFGANTQIAVGKIVFHNPTYRQKKDDPVFNPLCLIVFHPCPIFNVFKR